MAFKFNALTGMLDLVNTSSGSASNSFTTIQTSSGTAPVASSSTDTLTLTGTAPITVTGNSATDTVVFAMPAATASQDGYVTTTLQSINGQKTFTTHATANANIILKAIASQSGPFAIYQDSAGSAIGGLGITGQSYLPLLSASTPSYSFNGDLNTGIYSSGADSISVSTGGSERLRIGVSSSGYINTGANFTATAASLHVSAIASNVPNLGLRQATSQSADYVTFLNSAGTEIAEIVVAGYLHMPLGAVGTPTYSFYNDADTGIYSPGANRLALGTQGAEALEISANKRTHIGANFTADTHQLLVSSSVATTPTLGARAIAAQSADIFQAMNSSGTPLVGITAGGNTYFGSNGTTVANSSNTFRTINTAYSTIAIAALTSQSEAALLFTDDATSPVGRVMPNGLLEFPNASESAPTYSFYGNSTVGMFSSASNELSFSTNGNRRLTVTSNGLLYGRVVHNNVDGNGNSSQQDIRSGSDTTSVVLTTNINSYSAGAQQWLRVGNVVTVSCTIFDVDVNGSGTLTEVYLAIPAPTGSAAIDVISGTAVLFDGTNALVEPGIVKSDGAGRALVQLYPTKTGLHTPLTIHYTYEVT